LSGKKVAVARGSQNEVTLTKTAPPDAEIIKFSDDASAMAALTSGQVDAFASSEGLARPILDRFSDKYEAKYSLSSGFLSVGLRRGDPDMLQWLNTTIAWNRHKGYLDPIIQKWIGFVLPTPVF
jgi:polar amino acid transport system substrate-binding protein